MRDSSIRTAALPAILRQVDIFQALDDGERAAIASRIELRRFSAGEMVFHEGDPSDGLFVVLSGEVGVVSEAEAGNGFLARLGRGECFGEMSILTGEPRSTGITATLDSELLFLTDAAFEDLLRRYPSVALSLGRTLSLRLRKATRGSREPPQDRIIFCCSATRAVDGPAFAAGLARSLAACRGGETLLLGLGHGPRLRAPPMGLEELNAALRAGQVPELETYAGELASGVRALTLDLAGDEWTGRLLGRLLGLAVSQCRGIVVFAEAHDGAAESAGKTGLLGRARRQSDSSLLLVDTTTPGLRTARGLARRISGGNGPVERPWKVTLVRPAHVTPGTVRRVTEAMGQPVTFQVVKGDPSCMDRVARRLSRCALGIAFGGGGSWGLAHIGILDVLSQEGISVDVLGGTSMGAIVSSLFATGMDVDEITRTIRWEWIHRNPLNDYMLPRSAFIRGRRAAKVLQRLLGETRIEDLPRPYFAVAADLVTTDEVVMDRGPLWRAILASSSLPGLILPVKVKRRFLVDGTTINNVPGDLLGRFGADLAVAVDLTHRRHGYFDRLVDPDRRQGLFKRLLARTGLFEEWLEYPSIVRTLLRIYDIEGIAILKTKSATFDLTIKPKVWGFDQLDFNHLDELIEVGREAAQEALPGLRKLMNEAARPKQT